MAPCLGEAQEGSVEAGGHLSPNRQVKAKEPISVKARIDSVPASFANRPVSHRVYPDRVVVAAEGLVICEHRRIIDLT